jgi:hypothetical protein
VTRFYPVRYDVPRFDQLRGTLRQPILSHVL